MTNNNILPGDRVKVFDSNRFIDDIITPLAHTMRWAIVICRYGYRSTILKNEVTGEGIIYPDCCDVRFEDDGKISKGHFTNLIEMDSNA